MTTLKNGNSWRNALIGILILLVGFFGGIGTNDALDRIASNSEKTAANERRLIKIETIVNRDLPRILNELEQINEKLP